MTISKPIKKSASSNISASQHIKMLENSYTETITGDIPIICIKISGARNLNSLREGINYTSKRLHILYKNILRDVVNSTFSKDILFGYYYHSKLFIFIRPATNTIVKTNFIISTFVSYCTSLATLQGLELFYSLPSFIGTVFTPSLDQVIDYLKIRASYCARDSFVNYLNKFTDLKHTDRNNSFQKMIKNTPNEYEDWCNIIDIEQRYGIFYFKKQDLFFNFEEIPSNFHLRQLVEDNFFGV